MPVFPATAVTGFVSRVTATVYTAVSPLPDVTVNSKSTVLPPAPRFLRFTRTEQSSAGWASKTSDVTENGTESEYWNISGSKLGESVPVGGMSESSAAPISGSFT